jgi:hypothetical protein
MIMHSLLSLIRQIFCDIEVGVLGWFDYLCLNLKGKRSKISIINSSASLYIFFDVLAKCFND